jgi:hypothetical protein
MTISKTSLDPKVEFYRVDFNELPPNQALVLVQQEFDNLKHWVTESIKEVDKAKGQLDDLC